MCIEDNEVLLNDATTKLFLSTKGKAEGKIEAIRNAIKDGLTTLTWAPGCFLGAFLRNFLSINIRFMQKVCIKSVTMRGQRIRHDVYHIGFCFYRSLFCGVSHYLL